MKGIGVPEILVWGLHLGVMGSGREETQEMRIGHLFYETTHEVGLSHGCTCSVAHEMGGGRGLSCDVNADRE